MDVTPGGWTVIDRARGVLARTYRFGKQGTSWCFVARLADGGLMVVSPASGLDEAAYAELAEFGEVRALVANNGFHYLGQAAWQARFPAAVAYAPPDAMARIAKKAPTLGRFRPLGELVTGADVGIRVVERTKAGECWCWVRLDGGWAWFASDTLVNLPSLPPSLPVRLLFKWTGSAPGFRVFNLALKVLIRDKPALLRQLRADLAAHPPTVMVPAHGDLVLGAEAATRAEAAIAAVA